jgi:hypothetical protein
LFAGRATAVRAACSLLATLKRSTDANEDCRKADIKYELPEKSDCARHFANVPGVGTYLTLN